MAASRILIGIGGDQNDAVMKFQRDSDGDGTYDDIDLMAFELNVLTTTTGNITCDYLIIDGGTY